jgi:PAS domain S-box-containing protein
MKSTQLSYGTGIVLLILCPKWLMLPLPVRVILVVKQVRMMRKDSWLKPEEMKRGNIALGIVGLYVLSLIPNDIRLTVTVPDMVMAISGRVVVFFLIAAAMMAGFRGKNPSLYTAMLVAFYLSLIVLDPVIQATRPVFLAYSMLPSILLIALEYFIIPGPAWLSISAAIIVSVVRFGMAVDASVPREALWIIGLTYLGLNLAGISHVLAVRRYRRTEDAYNRQLSDQRRFSPALENSRWQGVIMQKDGVISDCNQTVLDMLGMQFDELVGRPVTDIIINDPALSEPGSGTVTAGPTGIFPARLSGTESSIPVEVKNIEQDQDRLPAGTLLIRDISSDLIPAAHDYHAELELLPLTKREKEIAAALLRGLTRPLISTELFVSPETVKKHIANIYRKLEIRSRVELAMLLVH